MKLSERLKAIVEERSLLKHPFYQAWSEGKLNQEILRDYAGQYFAQVEAFPRFVSSVHSRCPEISARKVLLENLIDEEITGTDHPELWMQFAEGLGADREAVRNETHLPETKATVEKLFELTSRDWTQGLCALFAYESQVPDVSASKIEGLQKFYGISDDRTLAFFKAHMKYDVLHSAQVAALIDEHANPETAEQATREAADALWGFLDGVSREAGINCTH
ncbi:MAG: CADD family putative folate metabolism protein [Myxococcaceae bacterium]